MMEMSGIAVPAKPHGPGGPLMTSPSNSSYRSPASLQYRNQYNLCPNCGNSKVKRAPLCRKCYLLARLVPPRVEQPSDPTVRHIGLTQGQFAIVDVEDYEWLNAYKWYAYWNPDTQSYYAGRNGRHGGKACIIRMHRVILGMDLDDPHRGDHENHNTLDNRRANLRRSSSMENNWNQKLRKDNNSGFKCVGFNVQRQMYQARIRVNGRRIHLGFRVTAEAAYRELYLPAVLKYHGEFACTG